jgi:hypothetical protein
VSKLLLLLLYGRVQHRAVLSSSQAHLRLLFCLLHSSCKLLQQSVLRARKPVMELHGVLHWLLLIAAKIALICSSSWLWCCCACCGCLLPASHDCWRFCRNSRNSC